MTHSGIKNRFGALNGKMMCNSALLPLKESLLLKHGFPMSYKDVPRLNYILNVCVSLYNRYHPGIRVRHKKYAQFHYGGSLSKCIHIILVFLWRIGISVTTFVVNNTQNYMSWCSFLLLDGLIDSIFTDLQHYQASEFYTCQKIARLSQLQDWFNGSF